MKIFYVFVILCIISGCQLLPEPMGVVSDESMLTAMTTPGGVNPMSDPSGSLMMALGAAFPSYAAYMPLLALLFKRPRKHLVEAGKKALPMDGNVDLAGAGRSVMKAVGLLSTKS